MIYFITAKPRVGKSRYAVSILESLKEDKDKQYHFIGNIEGYDFDEVLPHGPSGQTKEKIIKYIIDTNWEEKCQAFKDQEDKKLIFCFDECQSFLRSGTLQRQYKEQLLYFFEIAGHYGADIYLLSQDWSKLDKEIQVLVHEVHKVSQASVPNTARVRIHNPEGWEVIETVTVPAIDRFHDLYKSSHTDDGHQKPRSGLIRYLKWVTIGLIFLIPTIFGFNYILTNKITTKEQQDKPTTEKSEPQPTRKKSNNLELALERLRTTIKNPIATEMFDGVNCYPTTEHSYTCPNIKKHKIFDRIFTSSYCLKGVCDYMYFDKAKYIADGLDKHCCLLDGSSVADTSSQTLTPPNHQQIQQTTAESISSN